MVLSPTRQVWFVSRAQDGDGGTHRVVIELGQLKPTAGGTGKSSGQEVLPALVASVASSFTSHRPYVIVNNDCQLDTI